MCSIVYHSVMYNSILHYILQYITVCNTSPLPATYQLERNLQFRDVYIATVVSIICVIYGMRDICNVCCICGMCGIFNMCGTCVDMVHVTYVLYIVHVVYAMYLHVCDQLLEQHSNTMAAILPALTSANIPYMQHLYLCE